MRGFWKEKGAPFSSHFFFEIPIGSARILFHFWFLTFFPIPKTGQSPFTFYPFRTLKKIPLQDPPKTGQSPFPFYPFRTLRWQYFLVSLFTKHYFYFVMSKFCSFVSSYGFYLPIDVSRSRAVVASHKSFLHVRKFRYRKLFFSIKSIQARETELELRYKTNLETAAFSQLAFHILCSYRLKSPISLYNSYTIRFPVCCFTLMLHFTTTSYYII